MNLTVKEKINESGCFHCLILSILYLGFQSASGAEILTTSLETFRGDAHLTTNAIVFDKNGNKQRFDLNELLDIYFEPADYSLAAKLIFPKQVEKPYEGLPPEWKSQDVGNPRQRGSVRLNIESRQPLNYSITVKGAGAGIGSIGDTLHFVYIQLNSDFDILTKVNNFYGGDSGGGVGIMVRNSEDFNSEFVGIGLSPKDGAIFFCRTNQAVVEKRTSSTFRIPAWIRLRRERGLFYGYASVDGRKWEWLGNFNLPSKNKVNVGFYVYSGKENSTAQARFSDVLLFDKQYKNDDSFIILKDSSKIASKIYGLENERLNVSIIGKTHFIHTNDIARILFIPIPYEIESKLISKPSGVMFANGEFAEGSLANLTADQIEINTISGKRTYRIKQDVIAAVFNVSEYVPTEYEIYTKDGSAIFTRYLTMSENKIVVKTRGAGDIEISEDNLTFIRRTGAISKPVGSLKKAKENTKVQTVSGENISGEFQVIDNKIAIKKTDGSIVKFELKEIKELAFTQRDNSENTGSITANSSGVDIGINRIRGRYLVSGETIWIEGSSGANEKDSSLESYYFLNAPIEGDFEMAARLNRVEGEESFAGILIIDKLNKSANGILIALKDKTGMFIRKYEDRMDNVSKININPPVWFRAERNRRRISAYFSKDGKSWTSVFHYERELPQRIFAGLAVGSGKMLISARAFFDNFSIKGIKAKPFKNKLVLTSGSEIDCDIISANESGFRLYTLFNPDLLITTKNICYVLFNELSETDLVIPENRSGVLFSNNDFLEADFKSIEGDTLTVSSVILGIRYYRLGEAARAVVFNNKKTNQTGYQILLLDGTKLVCKNIQFENEKIIFAEESATEKILEIPVKAVSSITKIFAN
ncbi:MAG: hypothetical protein ACP5MG_04005 [Verrucomicrobiia bacterium]